MIIETIVSTIGNDGKVNFSPFGIKKNKNQIYISPYIPSKTLLNLKSSRCAVVNYTDNTSFFVDCITGNKKFKKKKCKNFPGFFLEDCFGYEQVKVKRIIKDKLRPTFVCEIDKSFQIKGYEGHNRAKASIIEACILASRVHLLDKKKILNELSYLSISVDKTAGTLEKKSWKKILKYIDKKIDEK